MKNKLAKATIQQTGDVNSKRVFENKVLLAQFLRDYSGIEAFKDLNPGQIEMVPLRYHLFEGVELNSDTAARVWQRNQKYPAGRGKKGKRKRMRTLPIYIVSLIEHKSKVDHNVAMQLLYYMASIWKSWEKEMEAKGHNIKSRYFRYPLILPIVYYEGSEKWTAQTNLSSRIYDDGKSFPQYVPDFEYRVVRIRDYSKEDLKEKKTEMALIMTLNRMQDGDFSEFAKFDAAEVAGILRDTPKDVLDIVVGTARSLLRKLNVPEEEAESYLRKLKEERDVGYLFENMKKLDIQEERRKTETQCQRADRLEEEKEIQKKEKEVQRQRADRLEEEKEIQKKEKEAQRQRADRLEEEKEAQCQRADRLEEEKEAQCQRADRLEEEKEAQCQRADRLEEEKEVQSQRIDQLEEENRRLQECLKALGAAPK